ncbi:MAG: hypothetical protein NTZ54_05165, partial [Alphaproteobacteria bacterium]|nr:hypothetical protein [Alphaproteobacteria bacterium]
MMQDAPLAALAVCLFGQDISVDAALLERLRKRAGGLRLFAICLVGAEPPPEAAFDRVVRL